MVDFTRLSYQQIQDRYFECQTGRDVEGMEEAINELRERDKELEAIREHNIKLLQQQTRDIETIHEQAQDIKHLTHLLNKMSYNLDVGGDLAEE